MLWCPTGRSPATVQRAEAAGLEPVESLAELARRSEIVVSLCPPAAAEELAGLVAAQGFAGTYLEANAIAPARVRRIVGSLSAATVVDGSVVGSPPVNGKRPRLYLSGPREALATVTALFSGTDVRTYDLGEEIGRASALKLAYASYQKASRVSAALSYALAAEHGVEDALLDAAGERAGSYLTETEYIPKTAARAWRWGPEMLEVADLLTKSELPDELMRAVAAVLTRWDDCRDTHKSVKDALNHLHRA